jgi:putative transposase
VFPERFNSVGEARAFMADFVENYNHAHRHTGIGLNTPADVHYGLAAGKAIERSATLAAARAQNPERFSTTQDPKILTLHDTVWINKPAEQDEVQPAVKLAA